jgi:hypothetical protein
MDMKIFQKEEKMEAWQREQQGQGALAAGCAPTIFTAWAVMSYSVELPAILAGLK